MISEVDKILKGRVEVTVEYDGSKKIIGISQANLTPNESGIVPLSKQNAFEVEKTDAVQNTETVEFFSDKDVNQQLATESQDIPGIKSPEYNDMAMENPIDAASPKELTGLNLTAQSEVVDKPQIEQPIVENNMPIDIQMPQMPDEIPGLEPTQMDNNLFDTPVQDTPSPVIPNNNENTMVEPQMQSIAPQSSVSAVSNDIEQVIEEKTKELISDIKNKVNNFTQEIKSLYQNKQVNNIQDINTTAMNNNANSINNDADNPLMNDALTQINNMVIPDQSYGPNL